MQWELLVAVHWRPLGVHLTERNLQLSHATVILFITTATEHPAAPLALISYSPEPGLHLEMVLRGGSGVRRNEGTSPFYAASTQRGASPLVSQQHTPHKKANFGCLMTPLLSCQANLTIPWMGKMNLYRNKDPLIKFFNNAFLKQVNKDFHKQWQ